MKPRRLSLLPLLSLSFSFVALSASLTGCSGGDAGAASAPATHNPSNPAGGSDTGGTTTPDATPTTPDPASSPGEPAAPGTSPTPAGSPPGGGVVQEDDVIFVEEPAANDGAMGGFVPSEKVDLLFVVDNSSSMADKQEIFKQAVPDFIDQMVNPPCVVTDTKELVPYPAGAIACPAGSTRIFDPVNDIHIGIISSSLGPRGLPSADQPYGCTEAVGENDRAWLLGRVRPELTDASYQGWGFLNWDAKGEGSPPGDSDLPTLISKFEAQVDTVGEAGCGFEAPLEAAFRFLSDPDPYESLELAPCASNPDAQCAQPVGVDMDLLSQREAFLRPDSVVVVMFLTDENDCSVKSQGQGYLTLQTTTQLRSGTNACDDNPNGECCVPCNAPMPPSCDADPATNGCGAAPDDINEAKPLRCYDQQRRFGIDFLRSTQVYVGGYIYTQVADRNGDPQPNPLFTDERGREKIFVVGIVGVPWQDTATPDTLEPNAEGRFDLIEASEVDWSRFLPTAGSQAADPFNVETMGMRSGTHPLTGDVLGGPGTWNAINGHDRELLLDDDKDDDLQYSCIFPLPEPRDCSEQTSLDSCDCVIETQGGTEQNYYEGNPLCYDAETQTYGPTQYYAKAYPGPRLLEVLRGVSCPDEGEDCTDQSVVASICPRQVSDASKQDYGFRPVIRALLLNVAKRIVR